MCAQPIASPPRKGKVQFNVSPNVEGTVDGDAKYRTNDIVASDPVLKPRNAPLRRTETKGEIASRGISPSRENRRQEVDDTDEENDDEGSWLNPEMVTADFSCALIHFTS
jgi:hypothetical protein